MNRASTAKVYTILNKILHQYYLPYPLENLDLFVRDLREAGQRCMEEDSAFPIEFYREVEHIVIRWLIAGFPGVTKDRIRPLLTELWEFHKQVMEYDHSDASVDALNDIAVKKIEPLTGDIRALYFAVLREYDREGKEQNQTE